MAQQRQAAPVRDWSGRDGGRWINERPTGDELAEWFKGNVFLHDDRLLHEHYVQGVTLIPNEETVKVIEGSSIVRRKQLVYTPYAKVETRVRYFWDYVALHDDWFGEIAPVDVKRISAHDIAKLPALEGVLNEHLPPGFFRFPVPDPKSGKRVEQLGCGMRARIYQRDLRTGERGKLILDAAPATKIVSLYGGYSDNPTVDLNAVMKAETGAVGRALGMAGMLVIPGSGVATAEDMADLDDPAPMAPPASEGGGAELPDDAEATAGLRSEMEEKIARLQSENAEGFEALALWAQEHKIDLEDVKESQVRAVDRQVSRRLG